MELPALVLPFYTRRGGRPARMRECIAMGSTTPPMHDGGTLRAGGQERRGM